LLLQPHYNQHFPHFFTMHITLCQATLQSTFSSFLYNTMHITLHQSKAKHSSITFGPKQKLINNVINPKQKLNNKLPITDPFHCFYFYDRSKLQFPISLKYIA